MCVCVCVYTYVYSCIIARAALGAKQHEIRKFSTVTAGFESYWATYFSYEKTANFFRDANAVHITKGPWKGKTVWNEFEWRFQNEACQQAIVSACFTFYKEKTSDLVFKQVVLLF